MNKNFIAGIGCGIVIVIVLLIAGLRFESRGYTEVNCTTDVKTHVTIEEVRMFNFTVMEHTKRTTLDFITPFEG